MTNLEIITVAETPSTSSLMATEGASLPHGAIISAVGQTAGRGQRGNSWEAEPGKNLTFSMMLRSPRPDAAEQFIVSQMVALGIVDALDTILPGRDISIKWPNDIYVGDRKICGILLECSLSGRTLSRAIAGIGINVNQDLFRSDAPNPVSVRQLTGVDTPLDPLLRLVAVKILSRLSTPVTAWDALREAYHGRLYRRGVTARYRHVAEGREFDGRLESVAPTGHLTLVETPSGVTHTFAFKEVEFVVRP